MKRNVTLPRIGPCRDPLRLWFLEFKDDKGTWRRYYANRDEARAALRQLKAGMNPANPLMDSARIAAITRPQKIKRSSNP